MPYTFKEKRDLKAVLELIDPPPKKNPRKQGPAPLDVTVIASVFRTPSGGIPGRTGSQCGSADCTPFFIDDAGLLVQLKEPDGSARMVKIWHVGTSAVGGDAYIQAKRCHGRLVADMEDCG